MSVKIIRTFFFFACILMGALWAGYVLQTRSAVSDPYTTRQLSIWMFSGGAIGGAIALLVLLALKFITQELYERMAPAIVTIVMGLGVGVLLSVYVMVWFPNADSTLRVFIPVSLVLLFGFIGISLGLTRASNWERLVSAVERQYSTKVGIKLVDTSVIIDGRITDICESGFIEGTLLVPRFVLQELQNIADSADELRRAKGRRGLDILKQLQLPESQVQLEIIEEDPKDVREVDAKLVKLAQKFKAKILTNDFNLNKVAQIEGVKVLNINDLANALKPVVLPDEEMEVKIIKEGKEPNQGVGYLDDGTMIVVDGGRPYMGRNTKVIVTSVLQTAAGRMIFTKFMSA